MKVLTIREPWASAIAFGDKRIENRTWKPPRYMLGRRIAIHAGKSWTREDREASEQLADDGMYEFDPESGTFGHIIATAILADVVTESSSPWFVGPYGWVLSGVTAVTPVPAKGRLGLWDLPSGLSSCCCAKVVVAPTGGDDGTTRWYECSACGGVA